MQDVQLQHQVVIQKIRRCLPVGDDAAYLGGGEKYIFRFFGGEECLHRLLPAQIQLRMGAGDPPGVALPLQLPHNGGADHALMSGDVNFCLLVHHRVCPSLLCDAGVPQSPFPAC